MTDQVKPDFNAAKEALKGATAFLSIFLGTGFLPGYKDIAPEVSAEVDEGNKIIILRVRAKDGIVGRLIGKGGKTAEHTRALLKNVGAMYDIRVTYEVLSLDQKPNNFVKKEVRSDPAAESPK